MIWSMAEISTDIFHFKVFKAAQQFEDYNETLSRFRQQYKI